MSHWKLTTLAAFVALVLCVPFARLTSPTRAADAPAPIDWNKARELYQKEQNGGQLTDDEKAYLDKAKAAHAAGQGPNAAPAGAGAGIDWDKAKALYQREQNGEKLTPEEQAYLDKAKAARGQGAGGGGGGGGGAATKPADPPRESTGLIPLPDMAQDAKYKDLDGGLYGGGSNDIPADHKKLALAQAAKIAPLDPDGKPAADGKFVLLSLGMSNTTMEFSRFKQIADADKDKNPHLVIVDGAQGGKTASAWADAQRSEAVWAEADRRIKAAGATPRQVQILWLKQAEAGPARLGDFPKHADALRDFVIKDLTLAQQRYPNLRVAYLSSRIYAGYAVTGLNPEPYAYEGAFAMRGVILAQIKGDPALSVADAKAPVILWGPYLWTDGTRGRKMDDLVWNKEDCGQDGTHPSKTGQQKVADLLLKFFKTDGTAKGWFTKP